LISLARVEITVIEPSEFVFGVTNQTPDFLSKFPLGKIPALEIYPSPTRPNGYYITEANAIARYICSLSDTVALKASLLGANDDEQGLVIQWIFFAHEHLHLETVYPLAKIFFFPALYDAKLEADKDVLLVRWLTYLENWLSNEQVQQRGSIWLVKTSDGQAPSLADVSVAAALRFGMLFAIEKKTRDEFPNLMRWWNKLLAVEEVKAGFNMEQRGYCEQRKKP
jgi:elongation factor 1-gamma